MKNLGIWGWSDGSVAESPDCSWQRTQVQFSAPHIGCVSILPAPPALGGSDLLETCIPAHIPKPRHMHN